MWRLLKRPNSSDTQNPWNLFPREELPDILEKLVARLRKEKIDFEKLKSFMIRPLAAFQPVVYNNGARSFYPRWLERHVKVSIEYPNSEKEFVMAFGIDKKIPFQLATIVDSLPAQKGDSAKDISIEMIQRRNFFLVYNSFKNAGLKPVWDENYYNWDVIKFQLTVANKSQVDLLIQTLYFYPENFRNSEFKIINP